MSTIAVIFRTIFRRFKKEDELAERTVNLTDEPGKTSGEGTMGRSHYSYTGLLYAQPTMLSGVARNLDMGGTFDQYNDSPTPGEADWIALASDWYAISDDLIRVMGEAEIQLRDESSNAR